MNKKSISIAGTSVFTKSYLLETGKYENASLYVSSHFPELFKSRRRERVGVITDCALPYRLVKVRYEDSRTMQKESVFLLDELSEVIKVVVSRYDKEIVHVLHKPLSIPDDYEYIPDTYNGGAVIQWLMS